MSVGLIIALIGCVVAAIVGTCFWAKMSDAEGFFPVHYRILFVVMITVFVMLIFVYVSEQIDPDWPREFIGNILSEDAVYPKGR